MGNNKKKGFWEHPYLLQKKSYKSWKKLKFIDQNYEKIPNNIGNFRNLLLKKISRKAFRISEKF